jgi:hypothetical protein
MNPPAVLLCDDQPHRPMPGELDAHLSGYGGMMLEQLRCFCRVVRGRQAAPFGARYEDAITVLRWQTRLLENAQVL